MNTFQQMQAKRSLCDSMDICEKNINKMGLTGSYAEHLYPTQTFRKLSKLIHKYI